MAIKLLAIVSQWGGERFIFIKNLSKIFPQGNEKGINIHP
jgi:hypothetical protein